jgi:nucleotide-binding universal stress UspA family protein
MIMQKILVACDGSANAVRAVRYAADLAKKLPESQLQLLYVRDPIVVRECALLPEQERKKLVCAEADHILQEARQVLTAEGVPWKECFRTGSPANEIALQARESGCDAIVMGTRGMGPIASVMIGSVATHTVHLVHVPVTLVK